MTKKSTTKPRGPGRMSAEQTSELDSRFLDVAETLFVEQGYARITMDEIARSAGATRRTLYARYANKAEVLTAVVNRLLDTAMAPHHEETPTKPRSREPRSQLLQIARELAFISADARAAGINRLIFAEAMQTPDLARQFLDLHARATDDVKANLESLYDEGALPRLPNSRLAAVIFIEMAASMPRLRALLGAPLTRKETNDLTATAVDIFLHGCGKS
ncbi:TetR/AcrR family transcriptional regulator [Aminobacter anthyllidis]|uniref:TetR/AcrR family transcriptional regulator n=1 Tax=Aminobacter anthyllidis TaxID=1035067 RepID=A0A9X1A982_9HYPH|nr:TetR/AcrR family transcriptional regulator [Aminobacter anthyllidis]MBT1155562.1 TetR/AcrR family transcriptional regulator [Aminobacter anthyllidis]